VLVLFDRLSQLVNVLLTAFCDRSIQLVDASLMPIQTLYLKLSDSDANVPAVSQKVQEQLDTEDTIIITDSKGQELADSSGTQG